ncbi:oligoendopeptidase F [Fluviispira vulneris]|uniref:oligoendopeptidase F n=1 Tax=Fluviispira vulneris TaxID=2763012 RepID=UPI0016449316|nr:oligoendopeptidase F [Fluviispira vulneris]
MKEIQKIQKRSEVKTEETWNLTDLFQDFSHWTNEFNKLPSEDDLEKLIESKYKNKLSQSPEIIYDCLKCRDELSLRLENLFVYASLRNTEDVKNTESSEAVGKIEIKHSGLMSKFAFLEPELLKISQINEWIKIEPLKTYQFKIMELIRKKPHILTEQEESLLAKLSVSLNIFDEIHSKWNNADLKFSNALDSNGKEHIVSNSRYSLNLQAKDRVLRKNTYNSYNSEICKWRNTITSNYYGNMLSGSTVAKVRKFSGYLEAELFDDAIPVSLYDGLIDAIKKNISLLHRSMKLRKKLLKIDAVQPYDRAVSLFESKEEVTFTWEEGRDIVLKAIAPLGEEYVAIATQGLTQDRWVDRAENEGKRSGAFSWGTYTSRPYMLQTWTGTLSDVYTLAHELGHSMHSYYSHKHQPYHNANYTIFVAEVASTLNEALLSDYILTHMKDSDLAKSVLSENIENFEGTVLRQVLFAAFEREASLIADKEESFTPDTLEEIYLNLNKFWYGSECEYPEYVKHEWMRIPHFYSAFYVYKYATSYCASLALSENLRTDKEKTREKIFSFLKAGGSKSPLDILKDAGIDFLNSDPVANAFENYKRNIELAEKTFS